LTAIKAGIVNSLSKESGAAHYRAGKSIFNRVSLAGTPGDRVVSDLKNEIAGEE
jgi:hypothetical protein